MLGGGGAGGSARTGTSGTYYAVGGGGAGGAYARSSISVSTSTAYTINIGAPVSAYSGTSNDQSVSGNPTWFGSTTTVFAQGGSGGISKYLGSETVSGNGGSSSTSLSVGSQVYSGGNGANGGSSSGSYRGGVGGSSAGQSSNGTTGTSSNNGGTNMAAPVIGGSGGMNGTNGYSLSGGDGVCPGGGGGGAYAISSGSNGINLGGKGAAGLMFIYWTSCSILTDGGTISGDQTICSGGDPAAFASTVLPSGGSGGTITYQWQSATTNTEASFSDISGATSATYDPPTGLTSTTYYRRKAKRCTGTMEVTSGVVMVTVVPDPNAPSATKSPNTATACVGSTLTLSSPAYGSIPGMSCGFEYATTTNGTTWTAYSDAVPSLVAVAGTNGIRIRVKGGCISGCEASSFTEYTWTVSAVPTQPSAITGASPICSGVNQTFSVTNVSGVTYAWTYSGTGTISGSGNSITLNATTGGTLTVTPSNGCGNGTARTLTISMTPTLSAGSHNSDPLSGCIGTNVSLLSLSGVSGGKSPYSYQWQINGVNAPASANSANATSSTYDPDAFTSSGIYSIRCKVTDACGVIAYTAPKVVNVVADPTLPSATQSPTSSPVCSGTTLTLTNPQYGVEQGMSCEFEYQTSFDGGNNWSSSTTVIPVLTAGGSQVHMRMRVSSNCLTGCNASPWQTYTWSVIQPSIAPTNISGTTTLCNGNSTTLTLSGGTAGTGATAQWFAGSCGSAVIGTGTSISVSPSTNTTYFVRYSGTCNTTTCASISVNVSSVTPTSSLILGDMVWKGSSSVDYTDAANWLSFDGSQLVPSSSQPSISTNVIIPVLTPACMAFQPNLDMKIGNARNFTIETGGGIDMGNGRLNVNGDFRNYGTFNQGTSTVNMVGSADRDTIYGVGASHTFYNLTIDKVGGIEAVLGSHIDVTNELRVVSKDLRLNSLNINLGTAGTLLDEGTGHRVYCDCATGYIQRIASIPAGVTVDPGNLGLTITTATGKPMGLTTIKRRHMRAGSQTGVNELKPGKPGVYRIFDVEPQYNGGSTYPLASGGLNVDLKFQYYIDEVGSEILAMEDQFMIWRSGNTGSTWQALGGNVNVSNKTISISGWSQFSWLTGGPSPGALPIELISFQANCNEDNSVAIAWSTASERNASHYLVEKSIDGEVWSTIGQVQATGNSTLMSTYELTDFSKLSGINYYRLTQFDINGNSESFDPVSVNCIFATKKNQITTYPNPSSEGFTVSFYTESAEENGQLTMMDASGRSVYKEAVTISKGNTNFQIGNLDVQPGIYYIHLSDGTMTEVVKHVLR